MRKRIVYDNKIEINRNTSIIIIGIALILITFFVLINFGNKDNRFWLTNADNNKENRKESTIVYEENQTFENITTYIFKFKDIRNHDITLTNANISFGDIIQTIQNELDNINYRVCSIGVTDDNIFIQVDNRKSIETNKIQKINIITIADTLTNKEWIELLEGINNSADINYGTLFSYSSEYSNRHYMYIYTTNKDESVTIDNKNLVEIENF